MKNPPHKLANGVWLDYRRAAYLEAHRVLCVVDLHLGYSWAHRFGGQLLPLPQDTTASRLEDLCADYHPERVVVLGDVIHRDVPVQEVRLEIQSLLDRLSQCTRLEFLLGNHDRGLERHLPVHAHALLKVGEFTLTHGDAVPLNAAGTVLMGHEHPAISLGDGVRSAKFPCFLCAPGLIVLPAFSSWSAGADVRRMSFLSPLARVTRFQMAVAILGEKLLPVPLSAPAPKPGQ